MLFCSVAFAQTTTFVISVSDDDTTIYSPYNLSFTGSGVEVSDPADGTATITVSSGSAVVGTDTYVCFYDGVAASCSDAGMVYTKATDILTVKGGLILSDGTDKNITLVEVNRASTNAKWEWDETNDEFDFNYPINVGGTSNTLTFSNGATIVNTDASNLDITEANVNITGTFNVSTLTASEIVITDASKNLASAAVATYPSLTELTYVKDVTSAIQTQLNAKDAVTTGGDYITRNTNDYDVDIEAVTTTKCAVIETPTDADNFMIFHVELGMQVTAIHCIVEDATSATIDFEQCDVAGDNCTDIVADAIVCDVGGQADDGTIDTPDLDVDDWVRLNVTATVGTPGALTACFTATMDD